MFGGAQWPLGGNYLNEDLPELTPAVSGLMNSSPHPLHAWSRMRVSIYATAMGGLGCFEFCNALQALRSDPLALIHESSSRTLRLVSTNITASASGAYTTAERAALHHLVKIKAFCLLGLGSIRLAAAAQPHSASIWLLNMLVHVYESWFWWSESMEPGAARRWLQNSPPLSLDHTGSPPSLYADPEVPALLFGVPFVTLLIFVNCPFLWRRRV